MYRIALLFPLLFKQALGSGKESGPLSPNLPPNILESLKSTPAPKIFPGPEPLLTCLPDYELIDGMCIKEIITPAHLACLGGHLHNGRCEITSPYFKTCPSGYELIEEHCRKIVETDIQFYCPAGYYDDNNSCAKSILGEAKMQCPIGELIGNQCITKEHRDYIIQAKCPEGTLLMEDGNCWKEVETFDCSEHEHEHDDIVKVITAPKEPVPVGKKVVVHKGKHGNVHRFRTLIGKETEPIVATPPPPQPPLKVVGPGKELVAVSAPHPTRVNVVQKICSKRIQVDAEALIKCPEGFIDNEGSCLKEKIETPVTICVSGNLHKGVCQPIVKRVPKHPGCPQGAYSARGKCWKIDEIPAIHTCPESFIDVGEGCLGETETPELECPIGLTLEGDNCVGELKRQPLTVPHKIIKDDHKKH